MLQEICRMKDNGEVTLHDTVWLVWEEIITQISKQKLAEAGPPPGKSLPLVLKKEHPKYFQIGPTCSLTKKTMAV